MSRYIDADKLNRDVLASWDKDQHYTIEASRVHRQEHNHLMRIIEKQPNADVVEVVRCKDCAYYREETSYCLNPHCSSGFYGHRVKDNHYCSYGERSENDNT